MSWTGYTAVPLPVPVGAGGEAGVFAPPRPEALVVVGFAYGRQDYPIIRQIYGMAIPCPRWDRKKCFCNRGPQLSSGQTPGAAGAGKQTRQ